MTVRLTEDEEPWRPMAEAPRDGSAFDCLVESKAGTRVTAVLHYGYKPMRDRGKPEMILWGRHNFLSSFLTPIGWRPLP